MRRLKNLKKFSHLFWRLLSKSTDLSKQKEDCFKFLWPFQKSWNLPRMKTTSNLELNLLFMPPVHSDRKKPFLIWFINTSYSQANLKSLIRKCFPHDITVTDFLHWSALAQKGFQPSKIIMVRAWVYMSCFIIQL